MSNLSCGTHVAEPSANKDCRKLLNQFCRFLPKLKLPISADAKLPLTPGHEFVLEEIDCLASLVMRDQTLTRVAVHSVFRLAYDFAGPFEADGIAFLLYGLVRVKKRILNLTDVLHHGRHCGRHLIERDAFCVGFFHTLQLFCCAANV